MSGAVPLIVLAFANDLAGQPLAHLDDERAALRAALAGAVAAGLCEVDEVPAATPAAIVRAFTQPGREGRVAILHLAGHADGASLLLETPTGGARAVAGADLAAFLATQGGLALVFLNACATAGHVEGLLAAGVRAVIATSREIRDDVASTFADAFYRALAGSTAGGAGAGAGARRPLTLRGAFAQASAATRLVHSDATASVGPTRHLFADAAPSLDDSAPWSLRTAAGAADPDGWSLGVAARNPLFGLPPLPDDIALPARPFRPLAVFGREDARIFFGRGREIRQIYDHVVDPTSPPLTLLHGSSGVGKSSLLAAGALPRLERERVPYVIRLGDADPLGDVLVALGADRQAALDDVLRITAANAGRPAVLVLDQLEAPLVGGDRAGLRALLEALAMTMRAPDRPADAILGFRKEWLAEIERELAAAAAPFARLDIGPLDRDGLIESIETPARGPELVQRYRLEIVDPGDGTTLAGRIADDLLADEGTPVAPVLQLLLGAMWDATTAQVSRPGEEEHGRRWDVPLYESLRGRGILLGDHVDRSLRDLEEGQGGPDVRAAALAGLPLDLLLDLTTPFGTAATLAAGALDERYGPGRAGIVASVARELERRYLASAQGQGDARTIRLAHDTIAPIIRARWTLSARPAQRSRRVLEGRAVDWAGGATAATLDDSDLAIVERGVPAMRRPTADEERLIAASRVAARGRRRRRRTLQGIGAALVASLAVALGIALVQRARLADETLRAEQAAAAASLQARLGVTLTAADRERSQTLLTVAGSAAAAPTSPVARGALISATGRVDGRLVGVTAGVPALPPCRRAGGPGRSVDRPSDGRALALAWDGARGRVVFGDTSGTLRAATPGGASVELWHDPSRDDPGASECPEIQALALAADGATLAVLLPRGIVVALDLAASPVRELARTAPGVTGINRDDGRPFVAGELATGPDGLLAVGKRGLVQLLRLPGLAPVAAVRSAEWEREDGARRDVAALALEPDGSALVVSFADAAAGPGELLRGEVLRYPLVDGRPGAPVACDAAGGTVTSIALEAGAIVTGDARGFLLRRTTCARAPATGTVAAATALPPSPGVVPAVSGSVQRVAALPAGGLLVAGGSAVRATDPTCGRTALIGTAAPVADAIPAGGLIVASTAAAELEWLDPFAPATAGALARAAGADACGRAVGHRNGTGTASAALLADGSVVAGGSGGILSLLLPGTPARRLGGDLLASARNVTDVAATADGATVLTTGCARTTVAFDACTHATAVARVVLLRGSAALALEGPGSPLPDAAPATAAALAPAGDVAVAGHLDGTVRIWETASGRERACVRLEGAGTTACSGRGPRGGRIDDLVVTPDGRSAIVATAAGAVVSVDLGTASVATVLPQRPVAAQVVSATADGRVLVGFDDGDVVIVGRSGTPERTIRTSSVAPRAVAIVPAADGGEMLASIDARGLVGLWPAGGGTRLGAVDLSVDVNGAAIAGRPEGPLVAAATSAGVRLLDLRATALDRRTCAITGRTLDRAGWRELVGTSTPVDLCPGLPPLAVRTSEEPSDA